MTRSQDTRGARALAASAFALVLFAASADAGAAQEPGGEQLAQLQERLEEAKARLKLTDEQVEQVRPIFRASTEKQMAVLEKHGIDLRDGGASRGDGDARRRGGAGRRGAGNRQDLQQLRALGDDLEALRKETRKELKNVLTKEQFKEFKKMQEENREAMRQRIRERAGGSSGFGDRRRRRRLRN